MHTRVRWVRGLREGSEKKEGEKEDKKRESISGFETEFRRTLYQPVRTHSYTNRKYRYSHLHVSIRTYAYTILTYTDSHLKTKFNSFASPTEFRVYSSIVSSCRLPSVSSCLCSPRRRFIKQKPLCARCHPLFHI